MPTTFNIKLFNENDEIVIIRKVESKKFKESVLKKALDGLDWPLLMQHLDEIGLQATDLEYLLGHLRRTTTLVMPYPRAQREAHRADFINNLHRYVSDKLGADSAMLVSKEMELIEKIERGYRFILQVLDTCEISKLSPEMRMAAYISRAAFEYATVRTQIEEVVRKRCEITMPQGPLLSAEKGVSVHPDAAISAIVEFLSTTLVMEARRNNWLDVDGCIRLNSLPPVGNDERYKAGGTLLLAVMWQRWKRTEMRRRFLGGEFKEQLGQDLPKGLPDGIKLVTVYNPVIEEVFDYVANERLNDRFIQIFMEMIVESNLQANAAGIFETVALLPHAFVSAEEGHAAVSLSELLNYDIGNDEERPGGLRLVEWLRGYAVLIALAQEHKGDGHDPERLIFPISRADLLVVMERCGLGNGMGERFIDAVTLKLSSRDLFDCPLIRMTNGSLMVFGPGLFTANLARVTLSTIGNQGALLSAKKGKTFELEMLSFFKEKGLKAESVTIRVNDEEYQYDVILVWGDYLFIFECKNYSLSGYHPAQTYYFQLGMRSSAKQVIRLAEGLRRYPEHITNRLGVEIASKKIVPCVLNALPFALPGQVDGVYFTDASLLKRFFNERYFRVNTAYSLKEDLKLLHRTAVHSLWTGDKPSPQDLMRQLEDPFQVKVVLAHAEIGLKPFQIGDVELVVPKEFFRTEMTPESFSAVAGASGDAVRKEITEMRTHVEHLKRKLMEENATKPADTSSTMLS